LFYPPLKITENIVCQFVIKPVLALLTALFPLVAYLLATLPFSGFSTPLGSGEFLSSELAGALVAGFGRSL
jgi:hypothetical protein